MNADFCTHEHRHHWGDSTTHPIEPRHGLLAALLLLAGRSPQRRRVLPAHRIAAHSGASSCGFQVESLASYDGSESCVQSRKGVGETLTVVRAGRVLSPRNTCPVAKGAGGPGCRGCRRKSKGERPKAHSLQVVAAPLVGEHPLKVQQGRRDGLTMPEHYLW